MEIFVRQICNDFQPTVTFQTCLIDQLHFVTTSNDNMIRIWELPELIILRQDSFMNYVYGIAYDNQHSEIFIGNGVGDLQIVDQQLKSKRKMRLHLDLITQIIIDKETVITSSIDSNVKISNKNSLEVLSSFCFKEPIWNLKLINTNLYVSLQQKPSVIIKNLKQIQQINYKLKAVVEVGDSIFGQSRLNQVINIQTGQVLDLKCEGITSFKGDLLTIDSNTIQIRNKDRKRVFDIPSFQKITIMDCKQVGQYFVVSLDNGKMFVAKFQE